MLESLYLIARNETNAMDTALSLLQRESSTEDNPELLSKFLLCTFTVLKALNKHVFLSDKFLRINQFLRIITKFLFKDVYNLSYLARILIKIQKILEKVSKIYLSNVKVCKACAVSCPECKTMTYLHTCIHPNKDSYLID